MNRNRIRQILRNKFWLKLIAAAILFPGLFFLNQVQAEPDMDSPFGVLEFLHWNHPWNNYKYSCPADIEKSIKLMKDAGISWVRMDFLWDEIEPKEGEFDFSKYDNIVEAISKNKINILALLDYSAGWAAAGAAWNSPPKDNILFVNYACKVIARYKDKIKYWEVWNEPDSPTYWENQDGLKSYCALLKEVYTAAKKEDPECFILNGGLANGLASVSRLYENGAKNYFDIMNVHFFASPVHANAVKAVAAYPKLVYKVMARSGDADKKIWVTEIGCPGVKAGLKVSDWWLGKNPTERQQAEWVKSVYTELLKDKNVAKVFWAFFRDCYKHWDSGIDYFGLLRWDYSQKPSFKAFKNFVLRWKKSR